MERSKAPSVRVGQHSQLGLAALVVVFAAAGCAYPDYTYVEDMDGSSGGAAGSSGTGGTGGTGGSAGEGGVAGEGGESGTGGVGGGGQDAGDADAPDAPEPDADDGDVSVDAADGGDADADDGGEADVSVDAADGGDADATDDAPAEADAPLDVAPEVSDCPTTVEDCTNGIDDNCDGLVDCEDPQCKPSYRCVPPVPAGWEGYYSLWDGAVGEPTPDCNNPFSLIGPAGWRDLSWDAATCSACQCSAPTDVACEEPVLYLTTEPACGDGPAWHLSDPTGTCGAEPGCWMDDKPHGVCHDVSLNPGNPPEYSEAVLFVVGDPIAGTGSCTASGGDVSKPTPTWGRIGLSCEADPDETTGEGCSAGNACVPRSPSGTGYNSGTCIYQSGVTDCPSLFTQQFVYYLNYTDTRDCTSCSCDTPNVTACNGELTVALDAQCSTSGPDSEAFLSGTSGQALCDPITNATDHYIRYDDLPVSGQCPASGALSEGSVDPRTDNAMTFCCLFQ